MSAFLHGELNPVVFTVEIRDGLGDKVVNHPLTNSKQTPPVEESIPASDRNGEENLNLALPAAPAGTVAAPWKTALLVCGSALLGATALALWNRRMLAKMQEQSPANSTAPFSKSNAPLDVKEFF